MEFSYPYEAEQFRKELRGWLSTHLTDAVIGSGERRGCDDAAFETLRTWNATIADAGWAAVSWPSRANSSRAAP